MARLGRRVYYIHISNHFFFSSHQPLQLFKCAHDTLPQQQETNSLNYCGSSVLSFHSIGPLHMVLSWHSFIHSSICRIHSFDLWLWRLFIISRGFHPQGSCNRIELPVDPALKEWISSILIALHSFSHIAFVHVSCGERLRSSARPVSHSGRWQFS